MSNWVWPVTLTNWPIVKSKKVWAVNTKGKGSRVAKGDKIIFYVKGSKYFQGIFQMVSDWHSPKVEWPDESIVSKSISEIDLEEIQLGFASLKKLKDPLEFIDRKKNIGLSLRGTPQGPANSAKPVSEHDYKLILEELKQVQEIPLEKESKDDIDVEEFIEISDWGFVKERIHELPPPNLKSISSIIADVEGGKYAIPIFQREFTWNRRQVEELWESIFQGFFVGSLLTWNSDEQFVTIPVLGAPDLNSPTDIILDGQQRITSLYYAVASPDIPLTDVRSIKFFVDLKALLDPTASASDIIISYSTYRAERRGYLEKETQFAKKLFPLSGFNKRDYGIWLNEFKNYLKEVEEKSEEEAHSYYERLMHILDYVWFEYKIPMVQLPKSMALDSVAEVFEKINSKGTQLGVFDLLNARFTKYKISLRTLWDQARSDFDNIARMDNELGKDAEKFILQTICFYKKNYCRRKELLSLDSPYVELGEFEKKLFVQDWNKACTYISKTIDRLTSQRESGFGAVKFNIIPYTVTIPVLAALMYKIEGRDDQAKCKNKIETWYWSAVLSDSYSGSTDSKMEKDFREMQQWFDDDSLVPEIILEQKSRFDEMNFHSVRTNESIYRVIMCLISKKGAYDFVTDEPPEYSKLDDHHIFPKSREKEYGGTISINSILNRTLIDRETNQKFIRDQNPSDYLKEIIEKQGISEETLRKRLESHLISSEAFDCLLRNDFNGFVEARRSTIRDECRKLIFPEPAEESDISKLLHRKEDQRLEYKSSFRWDMRQDQQNSGMEEIIMKELCSFLNSGGGNLLIGVNDDGDPIGLEKDYSTFKDKSSDGFSQHLTNMVNKYFDKTTNSYLDLYFHRIDGKEICQCKIKHAPRAIYLTKNNEKKFYVRLNNTSVPLDMEEAHKYISENWN